MLPPKLKEELETKRKLAQIDEQQIKEYIESQIALNEEQTTNKKKK